MPLTPFLKLVAFLVLAALALAAGLAVGTAGMRETPSAAAGCAPSSS